MSVSQPFPLTTSPSSSQSLKFPLQISTMHLPAASPLVPHLARALGSTQGEQESRAAQPVVASSSDTHRLLQSFCPSGHFPLSSSSRLTIRLHPTPSPITS